MPKIPQCDRCLYNAREFLIVCAVHPHGPMSSSCPDFEVDPGREDKRFENFLGILEVSEPSREQWQPLGAMYVGSELIIERDRTFYNGEEIVQPRQRWTSAEQLWLLDNHPMFTGRCPECGAEFEADYRAVIHWDCSHCGWMDDTV